MAKPPDDDIVRWFESGRRRYENFAARLEQLIVDLLSRAELSVIQVESRAKTIASFKEKIARKNYDDPMRQMTDLAGLRIVCYYLEDVEQIGNIIAREFDVYKDLSVKKAAELATDRFDYRSDHYIVSLNEARRSLGEWSEFADLRAEIQVRTALQHAWAAIDHKINYKKVREIPKELQRRLIRLSALFELADEEFSAIRIQQMRLLADQTESAVADRLTADLNDISFTAYLKSIESDIRLPRQRVEGGTPISPQSAVNILRHLEIDTVDILQQIVGEDWATINAELETIVAHLIKNRYPHTVTMTSAILNLVMTRMYYKHLLVIPGAPEWRALRSAAAELGYY